MTPPRVEGRIVRGRHLVADGVGEWCFEDEKTVFIDECGNFSAFETPARFSTAFVRIYQRGTNVIAFEGGGGLLWLLRRDGRVNLVEEVARDRELDGLDEPIFEWTCSWADDLVFLSDVGAYLFRDGQLAWTLRFYEQGTLDFERSEPIEFTKDGLSFVTAKCGTKLARWSDGRLV